MRAYDLVGQTICDTYVVEKVLGSGTMGVVLLVRHVRLPRRFAMKVLHSELAEGAEVFARFRREAEIASSLGHPHIVNVVDWNRLPDQTPFLIMEYLDGEDLHARMARSGPMPLATVLELARQVGSALMAAHKHGVVHRDLKPQNIFLCKEDRGDEEVEVAKVLDFGISKILGDPGTYTGAMRVMGTPLYMAPEQAMGFAANVDGRADQFALAAILYQALSGQRPFDGATVIEIALKVMNEEPPPLQKLRPDLPEYVGAAIAQAMSKEREQRFATVADFVRALGVQRPQTGLSMAALPISGMASSALPLASGAVLSYPSATPGGGLVIGPPSSPSITGPGPAAPVLTSPPILTWAGRPQLMLLLVALLSGVIMWGTVRLVGRLILPPKVEAVPMAPPPPPPPRPEVRPPVVPKVKLRFVVTPASAEIYLGGKRVANQVEVPRSDMGLRLEIKAPGYAPYSDLIVPQSDQRVILRLERERGRSRSGSSSGSPRAPMPSPF